MGDKTGIAWTDATWNPIRGCSLVSEGCRNCYAARVAGRFSAPGQAYAGLATTHTAEKAKSFEYHHKARWTGEVRFVEEALALPLRWKRPRRIFVNSMSDLFHKKVPDEWIDRIVCVMAQTPHHSYQVLTKRPERMRDYAATLGGLSGRDRTRRIVTSMYRGHPAERIVAAIEIPKNSIGELVWPLPNVWLGVSVEDQPSADVRIPLLFQTPAAVRWVSYEPALAGMDFGLGRWIRLHKPVRSELPFIDAYLSAGIYRAQSNPHGALSVQHETYDGLLGVKPSEFERLPILDWLVVGGESGPGARPFDLAWARSAIAQGRAADVPVFCKQLGAYPLDAPDTWHSWRDRGASTTHADQHDRIHVILRDRKGADPSEWPEDLRVREFPK
jgi:protein gp37